MIFETFVRPGIRQYRSCLLAVAGAVVVGSAGHSASAEIVIAFTSFEEPAFFSGAYTDPDTTDHELSNNPGEPIVQYTAGTSGAGVELGFRSFFSDVRTSSFGDGLEDGDFIGVKTTSSNLTEAYPDGDQGYRFQDPDGTLTVQLDTVDLTAFSADASLEVSAFYFFSADNWESSDFARLWVEVNGGAEIDLLNVTGTEIDLGLEGSFTEVSASLTGFTTATFRAELSSNSADEEMWIDQIQFTVIPEPGSLMLLAAGIGLIAGRRRSV